MIEARDLDLVVVDRHAVRGERRLQKRHVRQIEERGAMNRRVVREALADPRPQGLARFARHAPGVAGEIGRAELDRPHRVEHALHAIARRTVEPFDRLTRVGTSLGRGRRGIAAAWSKPGSCSWNEATMAKIASPFWRAVTRRVVKLRPSLSRSTSNRIGYVRIAAEQEIGMQRVGVAARHGALRGDERLRQHLSAKHALPAAARPRGR